MPDAAGIRIEGLAELRRGLKRIDEDLPKELRERFLVIGRSVADDARGRVPRKSGAAAGSIRAGVSGNNAYVAGGKARVPYYGWLDFGSRNPNVGAPRSVGPWTRSGAGPKRGRFIYPAIDDNKSRIEREAAQAVDEIAERALPK